MRHRLVVPSVLAALILSATTVLATAPPAYAPPASRDAPAVVGADLDTSSAIVVLKQDALATYDGHLQGYEKTRPDKGKLNPNSAAAKKYLGYLKTEHSAFARWLQKNVPSAKITSEFYTALNAVAVKLNGNAIGKLAQSTDVLSVEYNALYRPSMTQSLDIVNAVGKRAVGGGEANAGTGIKVGVIDSGIDYRHPFFDPTDFSMPDGFPKCDAADSSAGKADTACKYTTKKVIVAKTFYNNYNQTHFDAMPVPGLGDHGTHVAGTVAGVPTTGVSVDGAAISGTMSGVAPGAWLGNYNVFPGDLVNARNEDILNAIEAAIADGMDVITLSLGGGYHGNNDLLAKGLDNAVATGVVVTVAAGNSGPGAFTMESPGRARDIITAGASTNSHYVGQPVTYGSTEIGAAVGDFDPLLAQGYDVVDTHSLACNQGTPGTNATNNPPLLSDSNKLLLVDRGICVFSEKVANAMAAGAIAVIVINNVAGDPSAMARTLGYDDGIPAVMVAASERGTGKLSEATTVTVGGALKEFLDTGNEDILAGFSGQGPTRVDMAIKPDVTSVGVNVLSSIPCPSHDATSCSAPRWAFYSGTSMATPHLAGSAAVLLERHPTWSPAQVKSALVNTADLVVQDAKTGGDDVGPMGQGAGRENLGDADAATLTISPVSASFGKVSGSKNLPTPLTVTLSNSSGAPQTFSVSITKFDQFATAIGATYDSGTASAGDSRISVPASVTVPVSGSLGLTVAVQPGLANGTIVQGWITLTGASSTYHFAYWAQVAP